MWYLKCIVVSKYTLVYFMVKELKRVVIYFVVKELEWNSCVILACLFKDSTAIKLHYSVKDCDKLLKNSHRW